MTRSHPHPRSIVAPLVVLALIGVHAAPHGHGHGAFGGAAAPTVRERPQDSAAPAPTAAGACAICVLQRSPAVAGLSPQLFLAAPEAIGAVDTDAAVLVRVHRFPATDPRAPPFC